MAGTIRVLTRVFEPADQAQSNQEIHATLCQYFDEHPGFERIASFYGSSGTGFRSMRYFYGSSGENAWAIYRSVSSSLTYDLAFVWSYNDNFTAGTWSGETTYGVGFSLAWHSSSIAWNGTTNNDGADTFNVASQPWDLTSTVFPKANGPGGVFESNKNAPLKIIDGSITNQLWQMTIIGDDDFTYGFLQSADASLIGDVRYFFCFGKYTPLTSSYNLPLMTYSAYTIVPDTSTGATLTANIGVTQNGGVSYTTGSDVRSFIVNYPSKVSRRAPRPAADLYGNTENTLAYIYPVTICTFETDHYNQVGTVPNFYACAGNAFGNLQDVSRSYLTFKIENPLGNNCSFVVPFTGSSDFFLKGTFE